MKKHGLTVVTELSAWQSQPFLGGQINAVPALHGHTWTHALMANGIGFFLELPDEPSIYIAGDTVYTKDIHRALVELKPDITIVAAGSASLAHTGEAKVRVSALKVIESDSLCISVRDFGAGIPAPMQLQLGHKLIESEHGMGMALLLSNASFERLGGQLLLGSAKEGGTVAEVCFPLWREKAVKA